MTRLLLNLIGKHQGEVRMRGKKRVNFFPSFLRCMGGKQGANPSGGEKDIASPLYFRHRFQGRTDISDRLLFSQAMVQMSESLASSLAVSTPGMLSVSGTSLLVL